jgi:hypothetical protein
MSSGSWRDRRAKRGGGEGTAALAVSLVVSLVVVVVVR